MDEKLTTLQREERCPNQVHSGSEFFIPPALRSDSQNARTSQRVIPAIYTDTGIQFASYPAWNQERRRRSSTLRRSDHVQSIEGLLR